MILEAATLTVKAEQTGAFEAAFQLAQDIIRTVPGYRSHELQRGIEKPHQYLLLVRWDRLEDHTVGFRSSPQYQQWRQLLHHFFDAAASVEHYTAVG